MMIGMISWYCSPAARDRTGRRHPMTRTVRINRDRLWHSLMDLASAVLRLADQP
jgi:hypothetical protein